VVAKPLDESIDALIVPSGTAAISDVGLVCSTVSPPTCWTEVTSPRKPLGLAGEIPAATMSPGCAVVVPW